MKPRWLGRLLLVSTLLSPSAALPQAHPSAQTHQPAVAPAPQPRFEPATVVVAGKPVIEVRWGIGSITPQARATGISERLIRVAKDSARPVEITTSPGELRIDIVQGDLVLASVFAGDAEAAGVSQESLASQWQTEFTKIINSYRAEYSRSRRLERIGITVLVLLVTLAALRLLVPITRWFSELLSREVIARLARAKGQRWSLIDSEQLTGLLRLIVRTIRLGISLVIIYAAFQVLFYIYPQTRPLGERMLEGVMSPARQFAHAAWSSAPSLVFILIIAIACKYVVQLVSFAFNRIAEGHVAIEGFRPQWAQVTARLVNLALILLAVLIAYPYIPGSESAAFKGFSLFLGVLFSLGSTGVVANVLNGIILTYMDSFQKGDFVEIGQAQGYVEDTSLFVTRLRTRQQRIVTIPNSQVLSGQIINHSNAGKDSLSLSTNAGIGYDTPWRQVEAMLLEAAGKTRTVKSLPASFVLETSLNSFDITYELTVFLTGETPLNTVRAELNRNILDVFNEYGVQIMTPAYTADPSRPTVVSRENWYASPAVRAEDIPPNSRTFLRQFWGQPFYHRRMSEVLEQEAKAGAGHAQKYTRNNPYHSNVNVNTQITAEGSEKETRHIELALEEGMTYTPGDAVGILPENRPQQVEDVLKALGYKGDERVLDHYKVEISLEEAIRNRLTTGKLSRGAITQLAKLAPEHEGLKGLTGADNRAKAEDYCWGREFIDLITDFPGLVTDPQQLFTILPRLTPRMYSISSSQKAHPESVHTTVRVIKYESHGRERQGVASGHLGDRSQVGTTMPIFLHSNNNFRLPENPDAPVIMIGPGTGIAPFRAFLEERQIDGSKGKNWLFFGEQRSKLDFLYQDQLEGMVKDNFLTLHTAFSRDQHNKVYVQDRIAENAQQVYEWLEEGAYFYVCGDATRMAKDVELALLDAIAKGSNGTLDHANEYLANMKKQKRYQRDVY